MDPRLATTPLAPVTIRRLHDAVYALQALVGSRQAEIAQAQRHYALQRALRLTRVRADDAAHKSTLLTEAMARHFRANERLLMYKAEMETKELRRAEQRAAGTALYREMQRERHAEEESCLAMHMQEMETRHYIAEDRWRSADKRRRLGELDKVEAWQRAQDDAAAARAQELANELLAHQAVVHAAAARERIEREHAWLAKSKDDAAIQHARMAAREAARAAEKAERKARKLQTIQAQQQRARELAAARAIKHQELATEEAARDHMLAEDMLIRRLITEQKKRFEAQLWAAQREAAQRAKPDPLALDPARQLDADARAEARELVAMADEEALEQHRLAAVRQADEYSKTLRAMQAADEAYSKKLADRLFEARSRKLMHDEEMRLRRVLREARLREEYHERKERRSMLAEETHMRQHLADVEKRRLKRLEWTRRAEMCVEDIRSHQVRDLEASGAQIGLVFWRPLEEKTLQAYVAAYPTLLRWNIQFILLTTGVRGDPPWKNVTWTPPR
ncbi:hypothetical protein SPRG_20932 [Saprolegnia parasitica CBS 223.65]|uniref:Trichohyalin-plectin-homology domain-containing protein n=1 Tax=Saprolegnia parasitica (strain CBS 223.65) TaxID=695850 RepID=A0A067C0D9_SAPPC|nr:hypothetical protein SPRG_20932 [Saprolegnia parasitica CBS 223.65]KDO24003.1 hypothetical protein SPRG_20932 [Saprolegnia parasitica CBS 223.65]|eukprot:XP_012205342.1 hypothetical protein SPRG_20932 [Saprolegnia parasitica CBS 223.65]